MEGRVKGLLHDTTCISNDINILVGDSMDMPVTLGRSGHT